MPTEPKYFNLSWNTDHREELKALKPTVHKLLERDYGSRIEFVIWIIKNILKLI